jgi:hypothetical protein
MDWFSIGVLALAGAVALLIAWWGSRLGRTRRFGSHDPDGLEVLERKHDDIKRGTAPESSGL